MQHSADVPRPTWAGKSAHDPFDPIVADNPEGAAPLWAHAMRRLSHRLVRQFPYAPCSVELERPLVSFTFDDVPETAHRRGAAALEAQGARGTFYISTGMLGRRTKHWRVIDAAAVRDLYDRGHELGLHTHSHQEMGSLNRSAFAADLRLNIETIRALVPDAPLQSFAFPFGMAALRHRPILARTVRSSRSVYGGVNAERLDRHFIKTVEVGDPRLSAAALQHYLDEAARSRGWLVFLTHDVSKSPTQYGSTPKRLETTIARCRYLGFDIVPVSTAMSIIETSRTPIA